jgi:hypothetical protein
MRNIDWVRRLGKQGWVQRLLSLLLVFGLLATLDGCTRAFYRRCADDEVNDILAEKNKVSPWKIEQYHVYPDPRARFADQTNPDRPPMPPDDEAAYKMAPHPQTPGHAGVGNPYGNAWLDIIKSWDTNNRGEREAAAAAEKQRAAQPQAIDRSADESSRSGPLQSLFDEPLNAERQGFLLKLEQAVELGVINAREYQSFREDLYLGALPVTLQRFSFAYQWAATEQAVRQWTGQDALGGAANNWSLGSTVGFSKLFSTGALLTTAFANETVFNFLHPRSTTSVSTINLNLLQPFLRGGGRAVTLEPLTQTERNLVYDIRSFFRFREQFYVSMALGAGLPGSLSAASNIGGGGTGSPISVLASLGIASTDVAGQFRGYLPSLYRELDLAVDQKYVRDLEKALKLFEGFQEGGQVAPLQVQTVNSTLLNARNAVLKDIQDTTNALDQFKLQLGIPTNLPLLLDDTPGRPVTRQLDRYYEVLSDSDAATRRLDQLDAQPPAKVRAALAAVFTTDPLARGTAFQKTVTPSWDAWAKATDQQIKDRLDKLGEERRKLLDLKTDLDLQGKPLPLYETSRLRTIDFESDLGGLEQVLRRYEARPWEKLAKEDQRTQERTKLFRLLSYSAQIVLVWARNDRFDRVGQLWPDMPTTPLEDLDLISADVDRAQQAAVQAALANRVDLMNARAQAVDAWRQVRVTANALMGVFNVDLHLDSTSPLGGTRPLAFATGRTNAELRLNAQLPLVRKAERNDYRVALINYQRARRNVINLEDNIAGQVRFDVRQLHLFAANYKIQQKVLESLYSQVENALEVIVAPVDPDSLKASGTAGQANAAALTQQYLNALGGLNNAQTKMYDIWLSLLATRMQLYLDLERLPLDQRGVFIDEPAYPPQLPGSAVGGARLGQPDIEPQPGPELPGGPRGSAALGQPAGGEERGVEGPRTPARLLPPAATAPLE